MSASTTYILVQFFSYLSFILLLFVLTPQVHLNYVAKSTAGLSLAMMRLFFLASIIPGVYAIYTQQPLAIDLGWFGFAFFAIFILCQIRYYAPVVVQRECRNQIELIDVRKASSLENNPAAFSASTSSLMIASSAFSSSTSSLMLACPASNTLVNGVQPIDTLCQGADTNYTTASSTTISSTPVCTSSAAESSASVNTLSASPRPTADAAIVVTEQRVVSIAPIGTVIDPRELRQRKLHFASDFALYCLFTASFCVGEYYIFVACDAGHASIAIELIGYIFPIVLTVLGYLMQVRLIVKSKDASGVAPLFIWIDCCGCTCSIISIALNNFDGAAVAPFFTIIAAQLTLALFYYVIYPVRKQHKDDCIKQQEQQVDANVQVQAHCERVADAMQCSQPTVVSIADDSFSRVDVDDENH